MIENPKENSFRNIKYKLALLVTILGLFGLVTGTSYAILKGETKATTEQVIKAGNVELLLTENYESISKSITLLSNEEGLLQEDTYKFNIKNIGVANAKYDLKLVNEAPSDYEGNLLSEEFINIGLEINGEEYGPFNLEEVGKVIDSNIIYENEIINYELRIWLDENKKEQIAEMGNYKAFLKLSVEAEQSTSKEKSPNEPVLSDAMIPVYYDESDDSWKKADSTNKNAMYKWYNYEEKIWANSVTVTADSRSTYKDAPLGTEINIEDDVLTMQVWIPRYKYKVFNYNLSGDVSSEAQSIEITFESGTSSTGEIKCTDAITGTEGSVSETCKIIETSAGCTDEDCNELTYTHPAFTFGEDELEGFWVGKFEVSSDIECTPTDNVAINTEGTCNVDTIRPFVKPNEASWSGAMVSIFENNMMAMSEEEENKYGFTTSDDTHMMKNIEWGAVAYLSHSKYGKNAELEMNTNSEFITGCGPIAKGNTTATTECSTYETELGQGASTTGNIYGIYDMSGGAHDYVMGNVVSSDGSTMFSGQSTSGNHHSGYTGMIGTSSFTGTYDYPDAKYYDKYSYGTSGSERKRSKLGDAIREVYNTGDYGWYDDVNHVTYSSRPWLYRGGHNGNGSLTGLLNSYSSYGPASFGISSRLTISILN